MSEAIARRAFNEAIGVGAIEVLSGLEAVGKLGDLSFVFEVTVPYPNHQGLPEHIAVRATIPEQFPLSAVQFIPIDPCIRGFPHQNGHSRELCLRPQSSYSAAPVDRLLAYIASAREWFHDAAIDQLLKPDDYWELPDFRTGQRIDFPELLFLESHSSFAQWRSMVGQWGEAQLVEHPNGRGIIPVRFRHHSGVTIVPALSKDFRNDGRSIMGSWLMLPSFVVDRHRPSWTFRELERQCLASGIDFWSCLAKATRRKVYRGCNVLLVGAPIPRRVGMAPSEVHWQLIAIPPTRRGNGGARRQMRLREKLNDAVIPWVGSTNVSDERAEIRGVLAPEVRAARICLLGCGALGSLFADFLVRGAARDLSLFDRELLEFGNLTRHNLGSRDVGLGKASALQRRLSGAHPASSIRSFSLSLPLRNARMKVERPAWEAINSADVIIDCTADDFVFQWASSIGRVQGTLVIQAFVNAHARMLTLCGSGKHAQCAAVAEKLYEDIRGGKAGILWDEYDPPKGEVVRGTGCWHATFPARGSDIAALAASTIPLLERLIAEGLRRSAGAAFVLRRREPLGVDASAISAPLIEIAWQSRYR